MDQPYNFRRSYPNKRLDDAYRRFVRGEASLRQLEKQARVSLRTLQRYSSKDQWVEELEERKAKAAVAASMLTQLAAMAPDVAADGVSGDTDAPPPSAKDIILGVLKQEQKFWDRIRERAEQLFDAAVTELEKPGTKPMTAAVQLGKVLEVAERASMNRRRAYGIADVTKIEWEDKTPAARKHVDTIRSIVRQQKAAAAAAESGPHGPN